MIIYFVRNYNNSIANTDAGEVDGDDDWLQQWLQWVVVEVAADDNDDGGGGDGSRSNDDDDGIGQNVLHNTLSIVRNIYWSQPDDACFTITGTSDIYVILLLPHVTHALLHSLMHWLTDSLADSLIHSLTQSPTHSFTNSIKHSFIYSLPKD